MNPKLALDFSYQHVFLKLTIFSKRFTFCLLDTKNFKKYLHKSPELDLEEVNV